MLPRGARTRPARARAGQVPGWIPFLLLFSIGAWLVSALEGDVDLSAFTRIDPSRTRIEDPAGFVDARWRPALAARLASLPPVSSLDPTGVARIRSALSSLPFVAEVGEGRVIWPDGFDIPVRLREPAACIRVGDGYLSVSKDGVVLPGVWLRPPRIAGGWLLVLGPLDAAFDRASPGQRLAERRHRDALAVAVSMRSSLSAEDFEVMGAPVIDASHAPTASVEDPGVVLQLEGSRRVYFGRAPGSNEPGELPEAKKWEALARALKALRATSADARDWSLLDVRWDVPDILWRDAGDADPGAAGEASSAAGRRARGG